jgi:hypothetical protein
MKPYITPTLILFLLTTALYAAGQEIPAGAVPASQPALAVQTPEDAVRALLLGVVRNDQQAIDACIVPDKESAVLAQGIRLDAAKVAQLEELVKQRAMHCAKVGETFVPPRGGPTITFTDEQVSADRQQVIVAGYPAPFTVIKMEGQWKVDAGGMIAARKAVAKAKADQRPAETRPSSTAPVGQ